MWWFSKLSLAIEFPSMMFVFPCENCHQWSWNDVPRENCHQWWCCMRKFLPVMIFHEKSGTSDDFMVSIRKMSSVTMFHEEKMRKKLPVNFNGKRVNRFGFPWGTVTSDGYPKKKNAASYSFLPKNCHRWCFYKEHFSIIGEMFTSKRKIVSSMNVHRKIISGGVFTKENVHKWRFLQQIGSGDDFPWENCHQWWFFTNDCFPWENCHHWWFSMWWKLLSVMVF